MVRPTSDVRRHFRRERSSKPGKKDTASCKYCSASYVFPNATRLTRHILACLKCPQDIRDRVRVRRDDCPDVRKAQCTPEVSPTPSCSSSLVPTRKSAMTPFVDRMSPTDQQRIDAALAKALYSSNTPFAVVENEYWRELFNLVRPSYPLPSRYLLSGPLLDAEFQRARIHVEELLKSASYLTLLTDGWTNIRGESIVNFIVATPEPQFYKCVDTGNNRHTATYISSEIRAVIESLGSSKVVAVVTDNASNMKAACDLVTQHYPHVTAIGCAAHGLNLLMNDLMGLDTLRELNKQAREVIEYVKRSHIVAATFKQKQESNDGEGNSVTLKLPSKTRWAGVTLSLESLARNKMALKETVIIEDLKVKKSVRQTVLDEKDFWSRVNSALSLLNTISSCIASAESNMALLSDVPCLFHRIREDFDSKLESSLLTRSEQEAASDIIRRRKNFCVQPIHYAANVLDPRYEGKNLENEEPSAALDWLSSQAKHFHLDRGIVLSNFAEYRAHRGGVRCFTPLKISN
ncbi:uncharacterized protein LOC135389209 [Ornithodoros turicata]|uniref:uncharacterized protein LOC135389209 n=1 Tax=Ornithodoros turicata TaxID=34597 RepID=UPI003139C7A7